ncbi:hypothetical protein T4B_12355 [Trichinella pseudospiralis]|uniref:Uncharacterized protein n=1 Tax=Trichinella pseudospiralis TaxID=6337 RepID=A0A0V1DRF8_TRIPS|nr:hypothetical protein T4A_6202 [Trichinella pseudospiralis]KRY95565.1 hypothetical protein T4B_12355 [Trichinella pseudospiralis]KRY96828.1 hypothetical protein T4C_9654 [Trichinella pseudospiralis]
MGINRSETVRELAVHLHGQYEFYMQLIPELLDSMD